MKKVYENVTIASNQNLQGDYFQIVMNSPEIAKSAQPGQFVHLEVPAMEHRILRRPFSIYNTDPEHGTVSLIYKTVGEGSSKLSTLPPDTKLTLMGPLGTPYTDFDNCYPIIVAGGYGCAATYMLAKLGKNKGVCLIGGRNEQDLLLVDKFEEAGYKVRVSTDDGSAGHKGIVTEILEQELKAYDGSLPAVIFSCGPNPMLKAVGAVCDKYNTKAMISLDEHMCCGVGACFTCVCKVKADNDDGWRYSRTCNEGPVYDANDIHWD